MDAAGTTLTGDSDLRPDDRSSIFRRARLALFTRAHPKGGKIRIAVLPKCFRSKKRENFYAPSGAEVIEIYGEFGAGEGIRTLDPNLGKVALSSVIQRDRLCRIARASCLRGPLRGSEDRWTSRVSAV